MQLHRGLQLRQCLWEMMSKVSVVQRHLLDDIQPPEEVSNLSVVLVSDLGRMINGDTVYVTGGCGLLTFDDWS